MITILAPVILLFAVRIADSSLFKPIEPINFSLLNLNGISKCELRYSALAYNNYGCWCGKGGSGTPVDGIDECCLNHDNCYRTARINKICNRIQLYFDNYNWSCSNNTAICAGETPCEKALCKCDLDVVRCWGKFAKPDLKKKCMN